MKKQLITTGLFMLLTLVGSQAQERRLLDSYYQSYFKISDKEKGRSWDENLAAPFTHNLFGFGYHGGDNQKWLIMPIYPGSTEYIIASKYSGNVVDIHTSPYYKDVAFSYRVKTLFSYATRNYSKREYAPSPSQNIFLYPIFHGGDNQLFNFLPATPGYYYINSPHLPNYVVDNTSFSSENSGGLVNYYKNTYGSTAINMNVDHLYDPFLDPAHYKDNLYVGAFHGGANQQFQLTSSEGIVNAFTSYRLPSNTVLAQPPSPTSLAGENLCIECKETFKGEAIVPCLLINDNLPKEYQLRHTPYYRLEISQLWKIVGAPITIPAGTSQSWESSLTVGIKDASLQEVVKVTNTSYSSSGEVNFESEVGVGIDIKLLKLSAKAKVGYKLATSISRSTNKTTKSVYSHEENRSITEIRKYSYTPPAKTLIAEYQLVDRYRLYRMDGTQALEWDVYYTPDRNTRVTYEERSKTGFNGELLEEGAPVSLQVIDKGYNSAGVHEFELYRSEDNQAARAENSTLIAQSKDMSVDKVYPNPFQSSLLVSFTTPEAAKMQVAIYNMVGQQVKSFDKTISSAGLHTIQLDGFEGKEGMYLVRVEIVSTTDSRKRILYHQKLVHTK